MGHVNDSRLTQPLSPNAELGLTRSQTNHPNSTVSTSVSDWQPGQVLLDEFRVERELGRGGMGIVYAVYHLPTQQQLAVKRTRFVTPAHRTAFLAELQTWIDLPEHPHLTTCRFFRTIGEDVLLFTDLATGGSLADQIGPSLRRDIPRILDIAIQAAWGLHAVHVLGIVHQDVKPANFLLWSDGTLRVTDFSIARARAVVEPEDDQRSAPPAHADSANSAESFDLLGETVHHTYRGMSKPYCSPEQFAKSRVTRRSDIWSWGITVLEMFAGEQLTLAIGGQRADEVFRTMGQNGRLPADVAEVLAFCFQRQPSDRWSNLAEVAERLMVVYGARTGTRYPRPRPARPVRYQPDYTLECPIKRNVPWDLPRKWLSLAYEASGKDPTEVENYLPTYAGSLRAQMIADLNAFAEAQRLLEQLVANGQPLRDALATLCGQRAAIHANLADTDGAITASNQAIRHWEQIVLTDNQHQHAASLAAAYRFHAQTLRELGELDAALRRYDQVLQLVELQSAAVDLHSELANAMLGKGLTLRILGRTETARQLIDQAIATLEALAAQNPLLANDLARAYLAKAREFANRLSYDEAVRLCDLAIELRRQTPKHPLRSDLRPDLARAIEQKADIVRHAKRYDEALALCDEANSIWERLVQQEGRVELSHNLARSYLGKAKVLAMLDCVTEAVELCEQATRIRQRLVQTEGRSELTNELAWSYYHWANSLRSANQPQTANQRCDEAISLWERLIHQEGRRELLLGLARAYGLKAMLARSAEQYESALQWIDRSIEIRQQLSDTQENEGNLATLYYEQTTRVKLLIKLQRYDEARHMLEWLIPRYSDYAKQCGREDVSNGLERACQVQSELSEMLKLGDASK